LIAEKPVARHCALFLLVLGFGGLRVAKAQDNYEIQVYGSDTVAPKTTMLELHSNFTAEGSNAAPGSRFTAEGAYPTNHAEHETVEITQGVNGWSEVGFYIFTSARSGDGWQWVGDHIRPRVRAPDSWHWPVGVSLSMEFGYQRASFAKDTWTMELRPIIDKQIGRWYLTVNPALERSFHGRVFRRAWGSRQVRNSATTSINTFLEAWSTTLLTDRSQVCLRCTIRSSSSFQRLI